MTYSLAELGWSAHFAQQLETLSETSTPARLTAVHRDRLDAAGTLGPLSLLPSLPSGDYAVGDWVLTDGTTAGPPLERKTVLRRRAAGTDARSQLIAANVDVLFVTTSCNADFNPARLERYLALAHEAGCFPVILLTKADQTNDARDFERRAERLTPYQIALSLDARDPGDVARATAWIGQGQTAALVGSSGVGKTTLSNTMTGAAGDTAGIREDDAKGRHTTTHRSFRPVTSGGWLIDTPGMRALRLMDAADGIDALFADIDGLAGTCRFRDCDHDSEPGCAVQAAIAAGDLDPDRLRRWGKLRSEDLRNSETVAEARARAKGFGRMVKTAMKVKNDSRDG